MLNLKEIRVKKGLTQKQVAKQIGVESGTYSGYETGYSNPNIEKLIQLSDLFGVSIDLLVGHTSNIIAEDRSEVYKINSEGSGVPYYDVDFIGGFELVFGDQTIKPTYFIDFSPFNNCDAWINISGKSMSPIIGHGDYVALKQLPNKSWRDFLLYGEIYAIVTEHYRTIKTIAKGKDDDHLTLISYNNGSEFPDQQIPIEMITHLFQVKGSIKKFS